MISRAVVVLAVTGSLALAGCSAGASDDIATPSHAAATASAAAGVTEDEWLAALDETSSDAVLALLAMPGADAWVDLADSEGGTALLYAAQAGDAQAVSQILDAGADPAQRTRAGFPVRSAMHIAAANGDVPTLTVLLDHGVDVNQLDGGGGHALLWAAYKGQAEAVDFLLENGADVALVDGTGMNAAERAADAGFAEVSAQITEFGTD